jgi:glycosyltransferase involved in cell wall biosynthesis
VGSRVGGIPDLISDQETGLVCDPADLADIRSKVDRMLVDPEAARAIANRARDFAQARFNPKSIALRHVEIYRELLARVS